jgi:hypothetical protein
MNVASLARGSLLAYFMLQRLSFTRLGKALQVVRHDEELGSLFGIARVFGEGEAFYGTRAIPFVLLVHESLQISGVR